MVLIVFAEIKILTEISKPCEGAKSNRQQFKKHIQGFAPLICAFSQNLYIMVIVYKVKEVKKVKSRKILKNDERKRSIFMNKKWKRTTVLGGLAVIVMVILRRRKKQLKLSENNIKIVREKKKKRQ